MSMIRISKNDLMHRILHNALNCNLNVKLDCETPGYGNCWYHSVMQQIKRPDISPLISSSIRCLNEKELRRHVSQYINEIHHYCPAIQRYKLQSCTAINPTLTWDQYYRQQSTDGVYADELFIMATAVFIGIDIHINSATCSAAKPFNVIRSSWVDDSSNVENRLTAGKSSYLIIGYDSEHFQSLLPTDMIHKTGKLTTYSDVVKSNLNLQIKFPPMQRFKLQTSTQVRKSNSPDSPMIMKRQKMEEKLEIKVFNKRKYDKDMRKTKYQKEKDVLKVKYQENKEERKKNYDKDARKRKYRQKKEMINIKNIDAKKQKQNNLKEEVLIPSSNESIDFAIERLPSPNLKSTSYIDGCSHESFAVKECIDETINTVVLNVEREFEETNSRNSHSNSKVVEAIFGCSHESVAVKECIDETINTVVLNVEREFEEINSRNLHSNPKVVKAILAFEKGEMLHKVEKCKTCCEIRPVFNVTKCSTQLKNGQPAPINCETWKIYKDGRCKRCHEEFLKNRRERNSKPAKFSGIHSKNEDIISSFNQIQHNDMHFRYVPPYLDGLSTTEIALISKISVITNIHILKTGMFSSRGHTISLPHPMTIATKLPLLPEEVNFILLSRANSDKKLKQYLVQRSVVQNALQGLCYGSPPGGVETPNKECSELYDGPDHIQMNLHNKYFKYIPNPFYNDVVIEPERLQSLPEKRDSLPGLKIIECSKIYENNPEPLNPEDENDETSRSGIIQAVEPRDPEKSLKMMLQKILGDDASVNKAFQDSTIAHCNVEKVKGEPIKELQTPGFFAMAYPTIFVSGSCDITIPKLVKVDLKDWIEHIYYSMDNRVSAHPYLKFFLLNLRLRRQALSQGGFVVSQQLNDAHLTIQQLQHNLNNNDDSVPRKIISMSKNFVKILIHFGKRRKRNWMRLPYSTERNMVI